MALINALRFSFSTPKWANYIYCIYALSIRCYRLWNQLCQQSYRKHFSNIQLPIFLLLYLSLLHSPSYSFSPPYLTFQFQFPIEMLSRVSRFLSPQTTLNMSCTNATCIEPENWVKILFHFPFPLSAPSPLLILESTIFCPYLNCFHDQKKLFSLPFSISITNYVSFGRVPLSFPLPSLKSQHPLQKFKYGAHFWCGRTWGELEAQFSILGYRFFPCCCGLFSSCCCLSLFGKIFLGLQWVACCCGMCGLIGKEGGAGEQRGTAKCVQTFHLRRQKPKQIIESVARPYININYIFIGQFNIVRENCQFYIFTNFISFFSSLSR